jgi:hypothetical protein
MKIVHVVLAKLGNKTFYHSVWEDKTKALEVAKVRSSSGGGSFDGFIVASRSKFDLMEYKGLYAVWFDDGYEYMQLNKLKG